MASRLKMNVRNKRDQVMLCLSVIDLERSTHNTDVYRCFILIDLCVPL